MTLPRTLIGNGIVVRTDAPTEYQAAIARHRRTAIHGIRRAWANAAKPRNRVAPELLRVAPLGPSCLISDKPEPKRPLSGPERFWSEGKTLLTYKDSDDKPLPAILKDPQDMTWQEIWDTQNQELPTTSYLAWKITGTGVLNADMPMAGGLTIAERLPDDYELKTTFMTTKPVSQMTQEEKDAYEQFCAEASSHVGVTPYVRLDPQTQGRIEWERMITKDGPMVSTHLAPAPDGSLRVDVTGIRLTKDQYKERAKDFLRAIIQRLGKVPTAEDLAEARDRVRAQIRTMEENNVGFAKNWWEDVYLGIDEDPYREGFFDQFLHGSEWFITNEDEVELAKDMYEAGLITYAEVPKPIIGFRTHRQRSYDLMSKSEKHDTFYRNVPPAFHPVTKEIQYQHDDEFSAKVLFDPILYTKRLLHRLIVGDSSPEASIFDGGK